MLDIFVAIVYYVFEVNMVNHNGALRLRGSWLKALAEANQVKNAHQATLISGVCYPVVQKYFNKSETLESVHLRSLTGLLMKAGGLTADEVLALPIGSIFEYTSDT